MMDGDDDEQMLASAEGILHWLRLLAEEAAFLKLEATHSAIERALEAATSEGMALRRLAPAEASASVH